MKFILTFFILFISVACVAQATVNVSIPATPPGTSIGDVGSGLKRSGTVALLADSIRDRINLIQDSLRARQDSLNWTTPEKYGAPANGSLDDAPAIRSMIAATKTGGFVHLSTKTYVIGSTIVIDRGITISGNGVGTVLLAGANDIAMFKVVESNVTFKDCVIKTLQSSPTAGCGIRIDTNARNGSVCANVFIDHVTFLGVYNCIESLNGISVGINCCGLNFINEAIKMSCTVAPDAGDSYIFGNWFAPMPGYTGNIAIHQTSSGGLKIIGNKFNYNSVQKYSYAYYADIAGTSDLVIGLNSFENYTVSAIKIVPPGRFSNVTISGNQFAVLSTSQKANIDINKVDGLAIGSNVFTKVSGSGDTAISVSNVTYTNISNAYNGYGVDVFYSGTNTNIKGDGAPYIFAKYTSATRPIPPTSWQHILCTDCTATDGSTGVEQMYNPNTATWKNLW